MDITAIHQYGVFLGHSVKKWWFIFLPACFLFILFLNGNGLDLKRLGGIPFVVVPLQQFAETNSSSTITQESFSKEWNLTVVTAFFNLGSFRKGYSQTFTPRLYFRWAETFKLILSPVVIYTDSEDFASHMERVRQNVSENTIIRVINRTSLWAFQVEPRIKEVYSQPRYPKHYPNTVVAKYSCAQHAKYEVVSDAIQRRYFRTKYYAWLDIGYFRDLANSKDNFIMGLPGNFQDDKLGVNLVYNNINMSIDYKNIIYSNKVWIGGGMFIGNRKCIMEFEKSYRRAVNFLLKRNLMSTDQQVILSMYSEKGKREIKPTIELQLYKPDGSGNPWFYLGYLCRQIVANQTIKL